jgi:hypothetical protein
VTTLRVLYIEDCAEGGVTIFGELMDGILYAGQETETLPVSATSRSLRVSWVDWDDDFFTNAPWYSITLPDAPSAVRLTPTLPPGALLQLRDPTPGPPPMRMELLARPMPAPSRKSEQPLFPIVPPPRRRSMLFSAGAFFVTVAALVAIPILADAELLQGYLPFLLLRVWMIGFSIYAYGLADLAGGMRRVWQVPYALTFLIFLFVWGLPSELWHLIDIVAALLVTMSALFLRTEPDRSLSPPSHHRGGAVV